MSDQSKDKTAAERAVGETTTQVMLTDGNGAYIYIDTPSPFAALSLAVILDAFGATVRTDATNEDVPEGYNHLSVKDRGLLLLAHATKYVLETDPATIVEDFDAASSNSETGYAGVFYDSVQADGEGLMGDVEVNWHDPGKAAV